MKTFNTTTVHSLRWLLPLLAVPLLGACVGYPVNSGYGAVYGYPAYGYGKQYDTYGYYGPSYGSVNSRHNGRYDYPYGYSYGYPSGYTYGYNQPYVYNDNDYYYYDDDHDGRRHGHHDHDDHDNDRHRRKPRPPSNSVTVWPGLSVDRRDLPNPPPGAGSRPSRQKPYDTPSSGNVYRQTPPSPVRPPSHTSSKPARPSGSRQADRNAQEALRKAGPLGAVVRAEQERRQKNQ